MVWNQQGSRGMVSVGHALHERFRIRRGAMGSRVIIPRKDLVRARRVQRLPVRRKGDSMVELHISEHARYMPSVISCRGWREGVQTSLLSTPVEGLLAVRQDPLFVSPVNAIMPLPC